MILWGFIARQDTLQLRVFFEDVVAAAPAGRDGADRNIVGASPEARSILQHRPSGHAYGCANNEIAGRDKTVFLWALIARRGTLQLGAIEKLR